MNLIEKLAGYIKTESIIGNIGDDPHLFVKLGKLIYNVANLQLYEAAEILARRKIDELSR